MARNTIKIDGPKLRNIIERRLGFNIYQFCEANGYSRNLIAQAIRDERASALVQNLMRLYDISPEEYEYKEPVKDSPNPSQVTFEDIATLNRAELKEIVREAIEEALNSLDWRIDPITNTVTFLVGKEVK